MPDAAKILSGFIIMFMKNSDRLTIKQQVFINHYNRGMSGTSAAKIAYKTKNDNTAAVIASENLRIPKVRQEIFSIFITNGGLEQSFSAIGGALSATKYNRFTKSYEPDIRVRLKASKIAVKILGL